MRNNLATHARLWYVHNRTIVCESLLVRMAIVVKWTVL